MRKLSLFSGIGGIDLAAHWAGMETVAFCEREPFPQKVLKKHWPNVPIYDDVCTLTAERLKEDGIIGPGRAIDIISAGYPCQPFSHAGNRKGKEDDRHLWPEVHRLLQEIRPRWFVGENVAGHVTLGLDDVLSDLDDISYTAQAFIIPAASVGAPHRRDRVFIVAYSESNIEGRLSIGAKTQNTGFTCNCEDVANTASIGQQGQGELIEPCHTEAYNKRQTIESVDERVYVADTDSQPRLEASQTTSSIRSEWDTWDDASRSSRPPTTKRCGRSVESQLGGVLDGLSGWLDGYKWPAGQGSDQYDWEPPRVATDVKDRVGRLKALGNAVNPVQIYPILAAIKAINDELSRIEA